MELAKAIQPRAASAEPIIPCPDESSALLELPQELRNMIYHFAMHSRASKISDSCNRISLYPVSEMGYDYNTREPYLVPRDIHWYKLKRQLLGLMQTNRQLRKEFLSTFEECIEYTVDMHDLFNWLTRVVLPAREAKIPSKKKTCVRSNFFAATGMLDTILLLVQHHDLDISYYGILYPLEDLVHTMIRTPALQEFVRDFVVEIEVLVKPKRNLDDSEDDSDEIPEEDSEEEGYFEDDSEGDDSEPESKPESRNDADSELAFTLKHWDSTWIAIFVQAEYAEAWMVVDDPPGREDEYLRNLWEWCKKMGIAGGRLDIVVLANNAELRKAFEPGRLFLVTPDF